MKSPFTGGEVTLQCEKRTLNYRKDRFEYVCNYYVCKDTQEEFTTTELDELNMIQIYNQYRVRNGIPFPDEIKALRSKYGVSARTMSLILGLGENQYRLYENGEMPTVGIGRMINSIRKSSTFIDILFDAKQSIPAEEYDTIVERVKLIEEPVNESYLFKGISRSIMNGFALPSESKLKNTILYILEKAGDTYQTKMNKLLFYVDFYSYKLRGFGITGMVYKAIQYGPVPEHYERIYSNFDEIELRSSLYQDKEVIEMHPLVSADRQALSDEERTIIDVIVNRLGRMSATQISDLSHNEPAWIANQATHSYISFDYAFSLKEPAICS